MKKYIDHLDLPIKGIDLDTEVSKLDKGDYTFGLNLVDDSREGTRGSISNEEGNIECVCLPEGYEKVGTINLDNNELVIFSTDGTSSEIGLINLSSCKYTSLYNNKCLDFDPCFPITGQYRILEGCKRVVYWNDCKNPDRYLNIDDLLTETCKDIDCEDLKMLQTPDIPCLKLKQVNNFGGNLPSGKYSFQIELVDSNQNVVYRSCFSKYIPIYYDSTNTAYNDVNGSYNSEQYLSDIGGRPTTNKSITFDLCNIDQDYSYVRINTIRYITGDGITRDAHNTELIPIGSNNFTYTYTGFNPSQGHELLDATELLVPLAQYESSTHMEQVNNRLVRLGVKESVKDYSSHQSYASKICTKWVSRDYKKNEVVPGSPKDPNTYWDNGTFMADEVYAMGIVYINDDNTLSPAFHIPGRCKRTSITNDDINNVSTKCILVNSPGDNFVQVVYSVNGISYTFERQFDLFEESYEIACFNINDDVQILNVAGTNSNANAVIITNMLPAALDDDIIDPTVDPNNVFGEPKERWEVYNTAYKCTSNTGAFAYYECNQSTYNKPDSCCIEDYWGTDCCDNLLEGTPIRHHKFPCRDLVPQCGGGITEVKKQCIQYSVDFDEVADIEIIYTLNETTFTYNGTAQSGTFRPICANENDTLVILSSSYTIQGVTTLFNSILVDYIDTINGNEYVTQLGIQFDNIEYPPGVKGHYFVMGKRTDDNKTILDKGVLGKMKGIEDHGFAYFNANDDTEYNWIYTPKFLLQNQYSGATFIKIENIHTRVKTGAYEEEYNDSFLSGNDWYNGARVLNYCNTVSAPDRFLYEVRNSKVLSPLSTDVVGGDEIFNLSQTNFLNVYQTVGNVDLQGDTNLAYVSLKQFKDVYCNLDSIQYVKLHNCPIYGIDPVSIYGGDVFLSNMRVANTTLRGIGNSIWDEVALAASIILGVVVTAVTAGTGAPLAAAAIAAAIGITAAGIDAILELTANGRFDYFLDCDEDDFRPNGEAGTKYIYYASEILNNFYVESDLNYELRNDGLTECNGIFKGRLIFDGHSSTIEEKDVLSYFKRVIGYYNSEEDSFDPKPILCPEFYEYNKDYNNNTCETVFFPINKSYDFCSKCLGEYPNRIVWSEVSLEGDLQDKYLTYLANNFKDIPSGKGYPTHIRYVGNKLFAHTDQTTYMLQPNAQELQLTGTNVYIGTGTFLGIPEQELNHSDIGYAGSTSVFAAVNSPHGYTWVDQENGKIFNYTDRLYEISKNKLYRWFKENLPSKMKKELECINQEICMEDWLIATYDPCYERYILHKKDYEPKLPLSDKSKEGHIMVSEGKFYDSQRVEIQLTDTRYFCPCSWTISYSYNYKRWRSWHSYMPDHMFYNKNNFYSMCKNKVWQHNKGNYHTYYGTKYDHIIEYVVNDLPNTTDSDTIQWYSQSALWDEENKVWIDQENTFDKLIMYNNTQTTGIQNLIFEPEYDDLFWSNECKYIKRSDCWYKVNQLRDIAICPPVHTCSCDNREYLSHFYVDGKNGYIDHVPINYDYDEEECDLNDIKNKYKYVRLFFSKEQPNLKNTLHLINTKTRYSVR